MRALIGLARSFAAFPERAAMSTTQTTVDPRQDEANELYWHSDRTVDQIVNDLGIRRSALYNAILPVSAGTSCPRCGDRMVFTNRTNQTAGRSVCGVCGTQAVAGEDAGREVPLETARDEWRPEERIPGFGDHEPGVWSRWREDLSAVEPQRAAMVGGAAALGVVVGAAAARAVREML